MTRPSVALLDYGSGNIRSAERALERAGAHVTVTADADTCLVSDGLMVPGVGAFAACMSGLQAVRGPEIVGRRLAGGRPVLGVCVGFQVLFESGVEHGHAVSGCGEWPGTVDRLDADTLPHIGWNTVDAAAGSVMFAGVGQEHFYFVHTYGARAWSLGTDGRTREPLVSWTRYEDGRFVAAVENGPLWGTQFHPEKSGDAGARLLGNWVGTL